MFLSSWLAANPLTERESIHARQEQIEEQKRVKCQAIGLDCFFRACAGGHCVATISQKAGENQSGNRIVFHYKRFHERLIFKAGDNLGSSKLL